MLFSSHSHQHCWFLDNNHSKRGDVRPRSGVCCISLVASDPTSMPGFHNGYVPDDVIYTELFAQGLAFAIMTAYLVKFKANYNKKISTSHNNADFRLYPKTKRHSICFNIDLQAPGLYSTSLT